MILNQINIILSTQFQTIGKRIILILSIAVAAHILVLLVKKISKLFHKKTSGKSSPKILSVISLLTSLLVFTIYFLTIGYALKELGISLTAYIASASVIGLAVGFGSQGMVQDIVTGFTLIVSNQIDIGDMVEINGQTGIVRSIGMRFVVFENALGANVYIPNRNINLVINYPNKYTNCQVDIILPENAELKKNVKDKVGGMLKVVAEKYPKILVLPKPKTKILKTNIENEVLRIVFHIWPGRGSPIETTFKQELLLAIKGLDPSFADWMISVNYEIEYEAIKP
ncbi:mechanosensitive ion channel family protein [Bacteroidota bacterium]